MSDNKKILEENTIRRFMKLANVGNLTDSFLAEATKDDPKSNEEGNSENTETEETTNEELELDFDDDVLEEQDDMDMGDDDMDMGDDDMDMEDDDMDMDDDDMDMDDDEMGAADISLTEEEAQLLIDLGERLQSAMGEDEDDEPMDDEPMDDEPMDDEPMDDDPMGGEPDEEPAPGTRGTGMAYENTQEEKDEIVQEVLRRVTKRILAARKAKQSRIIKCYHNKQASLKQWGFLFWVDFLHKK